MRVFLLMAFLAATLSGHAQQRQLLNFNLQHAIETAGPDASFSVYLLGNYSTMIGFVRSNGGLVRGSFNEWLAVSLPVSAFAKINDTTSGVDFVEFNPWKGEALSDVVLINNNVLPAHQGLSPLPEAYLGEDVVIGVIDTGIELNHPDFRHSDGSTRVLALWDQTQAPNDPQRIPQPYNYGQEWTSEDIDAGISNHDDQAAFAGHGSTVAGVALGNGNATGDFTGVAPKSDIIAVSSNFSAPNWTMTVAEAVEYIFMRAEAIGKPVVVNASLGTYLGSHDGLDAAALHIDSLLDAAPGRAMVCAAGNSQNFNPFHLGYDIPETDTAFTWFSFNPGIMGTGAVFLEAWADVDQVQDTYFTIGADLTSPSYQFRGYAGWRNAQSNLNQLITDTIVYNSAIIGIVQSWVGQRGDQYQIQMVLTQPFSTQYRWRFATTGGGRIDCWSRQEWGLSNIISTDLPTAGTYAPMLHYRLPDKQMTMVSSWACSDKVVTVGNYVNQSGFLNYGGTMTTYPNSEAGNISINSSSGPTRDFRQKPEIAATGDVVIASGRLANITAMVNANSGSLAFSGMHYVNGGTSMASPIVAAAIALYFERCPSATYADAIEALIATAIADEFTGVLPGMRWGYGKIDVYGMLNSSVVPIAVSLPDQAPCEGSEVALVAQGGMSNYLWNEGSTDATLLTTMPGIYSVEAQDANGCLQQSASYPVDFLDNPDVPFIALDGDMLVAEGTADAWQWYFYEEVIEGATESSLLPASDGEYSVLAIADNGCSSSSDVYYFGVSSVDNASINQLSVYPNPARGNFSLSVGNFSPSPSLEVHSLGLFDLSGKLIWQQKVHIKIGEKATFDVNHLPAGLYLLRIQQAEATSVFKLALEK